jgi:hypothetical protein
MAIVAESLLKSLPLGSFSIPPLGMLPTLGRTFRPDQPESSAAKKKGRPVVNFNFFYVIWADEEEISVSI